LHLFSLSLQVPSPFLCLASYLEAQQIALLFMQLTAEMLCALKAMQLLAVLETVVGHPFGCHSTI